jgi:beta-aspartyl-dipeptidase (metallo-type)
MSTLESPFLLIEGGEVFAPEDLGPQSILASHDKIVSVGRDAGAMVRSLGDVRRVDASGKFVVPGFIDCHLHFLGAGDFDAPLGRVPELHLSMVTRGGVTTAVGLLGLDMDGKNLHSLLVKAHELERVGLTTYIFVGSFRIPSPYLTSSVRADLLLINKVLGVKVSVSEDCFPNLSLPDFARLAGEVRLAAGMSGKTAIIHAHTGRNQKRLQPIFDLLDAVNIPITQIHPTHVNRQRPDTLAHAFEFMKRGGTVDFSSNLSKRSGSLSGLNPDEAVRRAIAAGLPLSQITLSSDANTSMPTLDDSDRPIGLHNASPTILHREFVEIIRTNRLKLAEALPLVTTNVARVLGIGTRKGSLTVGKDADVVVLNTDYSVETVIARGRVLVQNGQPLVRGPWEDPSGRGPIIADHELRT